MKKKVACLGLWLLSAVYLLAQDNNIPHLGKIEETTVLMVKGKPFIVLGGELGNSTYTSLESMSVVWPKLKAMHLNTVLVPVYWELIEPTEGKFDFELYDKLLQEARKNDIKLVLLWFGSWKNSMSSHVPGWVKTNEEKYPRAKDETGTAQEILSPFGENNLKADLNAFTALMLHVKQVDSNDHTVVMVQPENEIGMLPSARDYHPLANKMFGAAVPAELLNYLQKNKENLAPEFKEVWKKRGYKTKGSWEDIFGEGYQTDEIFMAWYFARYTNAIAKAGKEAYGLPMFVNAALIRPGKIPGEYPSAGPLPHLMDIWKAGAPDIDMLSPDFYNPDFEYWNDLYTRQGNPLFIPEHRFDATAPAKAVFAIGHYQAIGFSPFSIESVANPEKENLGKVYKLVEDIMPMLYANMGKQKIDAVLLDKEKPQSTIVLGDYEFSFKNSYSLGWEAGATNETWDFGAAIIIQTGDHEFYMAGSGVVATFKNRKHRTQTVGILKNEEGSFENGVWKVYRHLNGDQTHQGRHVRIPHDSYTIQRIELYEYD